MCTAKSEGRKYDSAEETHLERERGKQQHIRNQVSSKGWTAPWSLELPQCHF